jgi:hypothetical protein
MNNLYFKNNIWVKLIILSLILFIIGAIVQSKTTKTAIFFLIAFILFMSMFDVAKNLSSSYNVPRSFQSNCPSYVFLAISAIIYIALLIILFNLLGLGKQENYRMLEINPATKCVLGPYTWGSPDSALYQFCSRPDVQAQTAKLKCGNGFVGRPVNWNGQWDFTPQSNTEWANTRCECMKNGNPNAVCNCMNRRYPNTGVMQ